MRGGKRRDNLFVRDVSKFIHKVKSCISHHFFMGRRCVTDNSIGLLGRSTLDVDVPKSKRIGRDEILEITMVPRGGRWSYE